MEPVAAQLVVQMLEDGESAKDFLRRKIELAPAMPRAFLDGYLEAAFWSSTLPPYDRCPSCDQIAVLDRWDNQDDYVCGQCSDRQPNYEPPADDSYGPESLTPETLAKMRKDCEQFWKQNWRMIQSDPGQAGHDFWLSRNGHGVNFLDDWPDEDGEKLTDASKAFGEVHLYVDADGNVNAA